MFSIQQCKRYLKNPEYSEQQIEEIRDSLYQVAGILVDDYFKKDGATDKKQVNADKRSSMVNEEKSKERKRGLVSRAIKMFTAERTGE